MTFFANHPFVDLLSEPAPEQVSPTISISSPTGSFPLPPDSGVFSFSQHAMSLGASTDKSHHRLSNLRGCRIRINEDINLTTISEEAQKVVLLSKHKFWVFGIEPAALNCLGKFDGGKNRYHCGRQDGILRIQLPILPTEARIMPFSSVALSAHHMAIGTSRTVLIFLHSGEFAGRWIVAQDFDDNDLVQQVCFSPDGAELVVLFKDSSGSQKMRVLGATDFPNQGVDRLKPQSCHGHDLTLDGWGYFTPRRMAFSQSRDMIAIATSYSASVAGVQLLVRDVQSGNWAMSGPLRPIQLFQADNPQDWTGFGVTGISLYQPFLVGNG